MTNETKTNDKLFAVHCPGCGSVTDKISWALLQQSGNIEAVCPDCGSVTVLQYDGETVTISHIDAVEYGVIQGAKGKAKHE